VGKEYTDEAFIWRDLRLRGEKLLDDLRAHWRKTQSLPRAAFAWPAETIHDDGGRPVRDLVTFLLPDGDPHRALTQLVQRTKAYAVLVVEPGPDSVRVLLESKHGTVLWSLAIRRMGDLQILSSPKAEDDVQGFGLLWRP
jgi:hypothetical protein